MTINDTYQEIVLITQKLVELGLSVQQNFPHRSANTITCKEGVDLAAVLKNVKYHEKYTVLNDDQNYNIKLLDGAIIQMMYSFNTTGRDLLSHRLAFFPAPDIENYEDNPDAHETKYFGSSEFHDLVEPNVIKTPLRFDYSDQLNLFVETHHPYTHLHLGEYEGCRIPLFSPLTPAVFINFILRNFYNTALRNYCDDYSFPIKKGFSSTITSNESKLLHMHIQP